jgi:SAM-dependent methyltransferase
MQAGKYVAATVAVDITHLYEPFLAKLPPGGRILDAGCGSGRDTKHFLSAGYSVVAIDGSREMIAAATKLTGQQAQVMTFQELDFDQEFDGIWACASLLHVPRAEMEAVWARFVRALKPGGYWYLSFKYGTAERVKDGRVFSDLDEEGFRVELGKHPEVTLADLWVTDDVRPGRAEEMWLNAIVRRSS